jgi:hypothetical protein
VTAANPTTTTCPKCQSIYVTALESGLYFCAECRNEWNPREALPIDATSEYAHLTDDREWPHRMAAHADAEGVTAPVASTLEALDNAIDLRSKFSTIVEVFHDDGGSGNWRTDRFTYVTDEPHRIEAATDAAIDHFGDEVGSQVGSARATFRFPDVEPPTAADVDAEMIGELEGFIADTDALAESYLESLIGTGVTLEGGQRAVLLGFPDDDHADVQLIDGSTVTIGFNDILSADTPPAEGAIVATEVDDETAQLFGTAALTLACLVIEAGAASIEGEGAEAHLIEPPSGWFPPDVDAIPLMEQAAAAAVAMLIQTFALPRAELVAMVERTRTAVTTETTTEETGHDEHPDDDERHTAGDDTAG